ncbi:MAG: hypothetical protein SXQ77_01235 [Halobacteria archaeon]|nr:hypothetical protein [Halobacteria archaeon]
MEGGTEYVLGGEPGHGFETAEEAKAVMEQVKNHELPPEFSEIADEYEEVVGVRDRFIWRWAHHLFPHFTLDCVDEGYEEKLREDKTYLGMFLALIDDIAEEDMDKETLEEASKIPFDYQNVNYEREGVDRELLCFTEKVWDRYEERISDAPPFVRD